MKWKIHEYQNKQLAASKTKFKICSVWIVLAVFFLMPKHATAQGVPVYDNTNFISLVKQLFESGKQTAQLIKSVKFLKDAKESIEKVSKAVEQLRAVEKITANNRRLMQVMQNDLQDILNSPYIKPDEIARVTKTFEEIVQNSLDTMEFIDEILSSDYLKMSDAERASVLKSKEKESVEMVSNINIRTKRYRDIISFRKMQDKVNNRETNY